MHMNIIKDEPRGAFEYKGFQIAVRPLTTGFGTIVIEFWRAGAPSAMLDFVRDAQWSTFEEAFEIGLRRAQSQIDSLLS
jgi:hypothetical protein